MPSETYPPILLAALVLVSTLSILLGLHIVRLRWRWRTSERLETASRAKWEPVLAAAAAGLPWSALPRLERNEQVAFLTLWLHLRSSLRGEAAEALDAVAIELGCDDIAIRYLWHGGTSLRVLGILVSGYLGDRRAWSALWPLTVCEDGRQSLRATWALLQIDRSAAIPQVLPLILDRRDWAIGDIAQVLRQECDAVAPELMRLMPTLDAERLARALELLCALGVPPQRGVLDDLVEHPSPEVLVATFRLASRWGIHLEVQEFARHPNWVVRLEVAKTLSHVGTPADFGALQALSEDPNWWVRYRAAEAIAGLPARRTIGTDRFARQMLERVLVEKRLPRVHLG